MAINRTLKKPLLNIFFAALLALVAVVSVTCSKPPAYQMEFALGTLCRINLYEGGTAQLYSRIFARIREIDRSMTAFPGEFQDLLANEGFFDPDSEAATAYRTAVESLTSGVVAINEMAGIDPVKVRTDLLDVLETALHYAELSDGAFDPTIGPVVRLWGIGTDHQKVPSNAEIAEALKLVNWRDLEIDRAAGTAFLRREGMALDLGAIAKGYAGDEAARIAREAKIKRAMFDLGGNIVAVGWREQSKEQNLPWRIGIQDPLSGRGEHIGVLPVHDMSVVTSGVYERFFVSEGKRYHHLFSPADGRPVENGIMSVTIVTESSTIADALSTSVFVLGYERGKALIDSIPGAEAVFVFDDRRVAITGGLDGIFTLTNSEFSAF